MDRQPENDEVIMEELEEGEVLNESDEEYTPLQRPDNYSNLEKRFPQNNTHYSDSEQESSTDLDSDSDSTDSHKQKPKKQKVKLRPKVATLDNKKRKYDIWSKRVQEDVLSETLNSCDVTQKDRSRAVESYDYVVSARYQNMTRGIGNKRTREDRKDVHRRLGKPDDSKQQLKGKSRKILELITTLDNTVEEIAKDIANKLYEEKEDLIWKAINVVGKQKCIDIFEETRKIESEGGMLIMNMTRRRTPGGVFLYLLRGDESVTREQKNEIFDEERKKNLKDRKMKRVEKIKKERDAERVKLLPELMTKAGKFLENRILKEVSDADVVNPPPTPETDGHETSCDGMENSMNTGNKSEPLLKSRDKPATYDDDFLDIACSNNDMDFF